MPHPSSVELVTQAVMDLSKKLQIPSPSVPFARYDDGQLCALRLLQNIFRQVLLPVHSISQQPLDASTPAFQALV